MTVSMLRGARDGVDVVVYCRGACRGSEERARILRAAMRAHGYRMESKVRGRRVLVLFADEVIEACGRELEAGEFTLTTSALGGGRYAVGFCDPNATKALHAGHLRSIAIGNAVASILEAAGAAVRRQSQVGDCGRSMGEAIAGYLASDREISEAKGDHFIGECYSAYVSRGDKTVDGGGASETILSREDQGDRDDADEILTALMLGDDEVRAIWQKVRDWVVDGQCASLGRLGVAMDDLIFEAEYRREFDEIVSDGLKRGIFTVAEDLSIVYLTNDASYPRLLFRRSDGLSTQHLRNLTMWRVAADRLRDVRSVQINGSEWRPATVHVRDILRTLNGGGSPHPHIDIFHEMVTVDNAVIKSSNRPALLVDDLLDRLAGSARCQAIGGGDPEAIKQIVACVALGFFLSTPLTQGIDVSMDSFFGARADAAWATAEAWRDVAHGGVTKGAISGEDYRFLVVQAQFYGCLFLRTINTLDIVPLAQFMSILSQWYLKRPRGVRMARVMRTILEGGFTALGLTGGSPLATTRTTVSKGG